MSHPTFGAWLERELIVRRLSLTEFSERTGISTSLLSRWINRGVQPNTDSCAVVAEALDVTRQFVLKLAGHLPWDADPDDGVREQLMAMLAVLKLPPDRAFAIANDFRGYAEWDRRVAEEQQRGRAEGEGG